MLRNARRAIYTWWVVNDKLISVLFLVLNLTMPFIVMALIWLGWLSFTGGGLPTECGSGRFKYEC